MEQAGKFKTNKELVDYLARLQFPFNIIEAFKAVDRKDFVLEKETAYFNQPLELFKNQTTSQPLIIAMMIKALDLTLNDTVLEVGTGSGYQTALLSLLSKTVHTIELHEELYDFAVHTTSKYSKGNIIFHKGNIMKYNMNITLDKIIISACCTEIHKKLLNLLNDGGIMVIPVLEHGEQILYMVKKAGDKHFRHAVTKCRFVMLSEG